MRCPADLVATIGGRRADEPSDGGTAPLGSVLAADAVEALAVHSSTARWWTSAKCRLASPTAAVLKYASESVAG